MQQMRARFINEIKRDKGGWGTIGVGTQAYLKGYYILLNKVNNFSTKVTMKDVCDNQPNNVLFDVKTDGDVFDKFKKIIEEVSDSKLDDLALAEANDIHSLDFKWDVKMFPSISGRIFGDGWDFQILYNEQYKIGYAELYANIMYETKTKSSFFYYFVKFK